MSNLDSTEEVRGRCQPFFVLFLATQTSNLRSRLRCRPSVPRRCRQVRQCGQCARLASFTHQSMRPKGIVRCSAQSRQSEGTRTSEAYKGSKRTNTVCDGFVMSTCAFLSPAARWSSSACPEVRSISRINNESPFCRLYFYVATVTMMLVLSQKVQEAVPPTGYWPGIHGSTHLAEAVGGSSQVAQPPVRPRKLQSPDSRPHTPIPITPQHPINSSI